MRQTPNVTILGVTIDAIDMNTAAERICQRAASKADPVYVTKPYVEFLEHAAKNDMVIELLNNSYLTLPDSVAVQWGAAYMQHGKPGLWGLVRSLTKIITRSSWINHPIPQRFAGVDFAWRMLEEAGSKGLSVYLIGHPQGATIEHTAQIIADKLPNLAVVGTFDGYAANNLEHDLVASLRQTKPDLILVGIGFPRQEQLMSRLVSQLDHGVLIGEGGTFDYESFGGKFKRAPAWMRQTGLEWMWRLILQPTRLRRQLSIPAFIWRLYRAKKHV
jgi:N-acetylglucosaminyldiphosphoundecaprenol N-acetyl-beta-D-mannosaminyltransferase